MNELTDEQVMTAPQPPAELTDEQVSAPPAAAPATGYRGPPIPIAAQLFPAFSAAMRAFGHGFEEGFDRSEIMSQEAARRIRELGIMKEDNPFEAATEKLAFAMLATSSTGQLLARGANAAFRGAQEAVAGFGQGLGETPLGRAIDAPGLFKELALMPEAFMGSPHPMGVPKSFPAGTVFREVPKAARALPDAKVPVIEAYHGSPYDFERFDFNKIGEGEGAQSYGHGLYFAENQKVAESYASTVEPGSAAAGIGLKGGPVYRVRISANPEHMLDWDKPLSEQPMVVAAFERAWEKTGEPQPRNGWASMSAEEAYDYFSGLAGPGNASAALSGEGVPGIKYFDQGSRGGAGTGTRNFVLFDDKSIEITHKNGVPVGPSNVIDPHAAPPVLAEARDLGVIGPPRPDPAVGTPAQAAEAQVPRAAAAVLSGDDVLRGPLPSEPEKAGNIRLDQIGINADAKDVIREAAKANDDFNDARAGNVPLAQVESLAGASGVPSEVLSANDGLGRLMQNDAVVRTWLQAFHQASDEIAKQLQVVKNTGDEAEIAKLREMKLRFQHMQEQVSGLTAEAGRTLRVFRDFYEARGQAEAMGKLLEDHPGNDADSLKKLADAAGSLDPRTQLPRFLHDARQPTWWDKYLYYWVNALISGPITHTKYVMANAAFGAYEAGIVTPIAGAMGTLRRALGGDGGVYAGEAAARMWGLLAGTPDALRAAFTAARDNVMTPLPSEAAATTGVNPLTQLRPAPIGGRLGLVLGFPGRSAAGIHSFFRFLGYRAEIEARAYRTAASEGLSPTDGDAFWKRRAALADQPSQEAIDAGIQNGNHLTFIGEMGTFGQAISKLANTRMGPGGMQPFKLILPFTHIPGQILRAGLEQTPAAFLDAKMRADLLGRNGAVAADTARARLVAGGLIGGMVANWALNGVLTGYGPTEPGDRARWLRTHEPYSARIGGWWVSYNKFGPIGDLMGLIANLVEVGPHVKENEYAEAAGRVIKATSRILEDEVGMQGLVNLIESLEDPDRKMGRFLSGQAASNLPYSSLLRQSASFNDPILREAKTFVDQLRYNTPLTRQDLLPKRDWLGQPMDNPAYHSILRQRAVNADPIDLEVAGMSIKPGPPLPRVGGVALPPKMYDEYQALAGGLTRAALERMVSAPGWYSMPRYGREQVFHATIESMRKTAGAMMQARHPELIEQGMQDRRDKINGVKPTKLQDTP